MDGVVGTTTPALLNCEGLSFIDSKVQFFFFHLSFPVSNPSMKTWTKLI